MASKSKLQPATFIMTRPQLQWLEAYSEKTGLTKVEIVRRALDAYADAEAEKERRHLFTPQQREDLRRTSRARGLSEVQIIRAALARELRYLEKLRQNQKEN